LERLERALQSQREFTADAAHELRTPLAILRTRVDTMLDHRAAKEFQADIDTLSHILDQLLELAELEGAAVGRWEPADINVLCADVVCLMASIALAEKKSLELAPWQEPVISMCNPEMLSRAIRNLVENAIRHWPLGWMR
jgi:signal transduction histidine kinase